jgi:hypothetical protein
MVAGVAVIPTMVAGVETDQIDQIIIIIIEKIIHTAI